MPRTTIKERLVGLIQKEGYDFLTSCTIATDCMEEFRLSGTKTKTYCIGDGNTT